ncbi:MULTISPECIES: hypothetical protein [Pseudomonas]|uniref:hypothetical protein n=1 Tax=Pseudomonas TaxID=286 RepID=UPI002595A088|nr:MULTISPECIES: hypothetical protein [Pseudomonas]
MAQTSELDVLPLLEKIITANSPVSLAILVFAAVIWIAGGNLLISYHFRRVGNKRPRLFPFNNFNRFEWAALLVLLLTVFASFLIALSINEK